MAKNNNLTDFLTGVADAIRTKKGTTALINPQNFETEISSITTAAEKPEQEKTVDLAMGSGNQVVTPDSGKSLSKVTINKPSTLVAGNIKKDVIIGGVIGTLDESPDLEERTVTLTTNGTTEYTPSTGKDGFSKFTTTVNVPIPETQEKTVDLAMSSGNQVVSPDSGKVISKVTINKPSTLTPGNIKKDVVIGGVTGTLDETIDLEEKSATITSNGTTEYTPSAGKDGLSKVTITTNVPAPEPELEEKSVTINSNGTKEYTPSTGKDGFSKFTVTTDVTPDTEVRTMPLNMSTGNQEITPHDGKLMSKAIVEKPATFIPENIKKDVIIGGVVGTCEANNWTAETDEEMTALYTVDNVGKVVKFTGTSSNVFLMDKYYLIGPVTYSITYNLTNVTGNSGNPTTIDSGKAMTIAFTAADGYTLPDSVTVTGATIQSWNKSTGVLMLKNATDAVIVSVVGVKPT